MKVLHLRLKGKWYRMIESGVKTEEYRKIKPYWIKRLCVSSNERICKEKASACASCFFWSDPFIIANFTHVCLHYGYTNKSMTKEITAITYGPGKHEWGAPRGEDVFIIKFSNEGDD